MSWDSNKVTGQILEAAEWNTMTAYIKALIPDHTTAYDHTKLHTRQHAINAVADHTGVPSATTDNYLSFDSNGLPKDSGDNAASFDVAGAGVAAVVAHQVTYDHASYDSHLADATIHFTESSIDHRNIQYAGSKTHAQIDTHINSNHVNSFNTRTGAVTPANNDYTWAQVNKSTSSIADITTKTHALLGSLNADDHAQYILVDGTRAFIGTVGGITPTSTSHLATKGYVDGLMQGLDWQKSVLDRYDPTGGLPGTPSTGDRYLSTATANGWIDKYLYEYNGATWDATVPNDGYAVYVEDETKQYTYNGTDWVTFGSTVSHDVLLDVSANDHHNQQHAIDSATEHTSTITQNNMMDADSNGLPDDSGISVTNVAAAITHITNNGSDHSFIDQSVVSGAAPAFLATNFSDGGSNAIITTTQETNFETAYSHSQSNSQSHTDYLINNGNDITSGNLSIVKSAATFTLQTDDASDASLIWSTTNSGHLVTAYLDESAANCNFIIGNDNSDSFNFYLKTADGYSTTLGLYSGTNWSYIRKENDDDLRIDVLTQDADLIFEIDDGGVDKTITWDASEDLLLHSADLFNFGDNMAISGITPEFKWLSTDDSNYYGRIFRTASGRILSFANQVYKPGDAEYVGHPVQDLSSVHTAAYSGLLRDHPVTFPTGTLTKFDVYSADNGYIKIKVFRPAVGWDFVGESELFAIVIGLNSDLTLASPIDVQAGDVIGFYSPDARIESESNVAYLSSYYNGDVTSNVTWSDRAYQISIRAYIITEGTVNERLGFRLRDGVTNSEGYIWDLGDITNHDGYGYIWNDVELYDAKRFYLRDSAIYISSEADTFLDLTADGAIRLNQNTLIDTTKKLEFNDVNSYFQYSGGDLDLFLAANKTLELQTNVYDDLFLSISGAKQPAANFPTWTAFDTNLKSYTFALNDYVDLQTTEILHGYAEGTNIELHVHIVTDGANDGTERKVKYIIYYSWGDDNEVMPAEANVSGEHTIVASEADKTHHVISLGTITGTGYKINSALKMRIKRLGSTGTEPANDPFVEMVGVHYELNTIGSREQLAK